MKIRVMIISIVFFVLAVNVFAEKPNIEFDLNIIIPKQFSYIGVKYDGPIQRYINGYSKGFREALYKYSAGNLLEPDKVSGWGDFIGGHNDGFNNAKLQLNRMEKNIGGDELLKKVKILLEL